MTNLFIQEPIYISLEDLTDSTVKDEIKTLSDNDKKKLIYESQKIIDAYIVSYWEKFEESQEFLFPIMDWDNPLIPNDIKISTVYVCEKIYEVWDNISNESNIWNVRKEVAWDYSIEYFTKTYWNVNEIIPDKAKYLLDKYKSSFIKLLV